MIQILELFGGVGSPRVALREMGIPVKAIDYVEIDEKAVRSYNAMFEKELKNKAQSVVGWNLKPDILIHGSPCQDISIAGHQKGADEGSETRSSLMWETINIIKQMGVWKPRVVIWENVKAVTGKKMLKNFNRYLQEMSELGYTNSFECLNSLDFGLPQSRERVFTVSVLAPIVFNFDNLQKRKAPHISELLEEFERVPKQYIVNQPSVLGCIGEKGVRRATAIQDYSMTVTCRQDRTPAQVVEYEKGKYRYLTELECWRLQGYEDIDYINAARANPSTKNKMNRALYKQAGNSIPTTIFIAIFEELFSGLYLKGES